MAVGAVGTPLESRACAVPLIEFVLSTVPLNVVRPVCSVSERVSPLCEPVIGPDQKQSGTAPGVAAVHGVPCPDQVPEIEPPLASTTESLRPESKEPVTLPVGEVQSPVKSMRLAVPVVLPPQLHTMRTIPKSRGSIFDRIRHTPSRTWPDPFRKQVRSNRQQSTIIR